MMCDHSPNREAAMVVIDPGIWCDPCLVPLVTALNEGNVPTVASCCGHGNYEGWIALNDGRVLVIEPNLDAAKQRVATTQPETT